MKNKMIWKGYRLIPLENENRVIMNVNDGEHWANLPKYLDEVNHSPDGFEWGYNGSGPAQLAYAILRSYYVIGLKKSSAEAKAEIFILHQRFKEDIVNRRFGRGDEWELTSDEVDEWLERRKD